MRRRQIFAMQAQQKQIAPVVLPNVRVTEPEAVSDRLPPPVAPKRRGRPPKVRNG